MIGSRAEANGRERQRLVAHAVDPVHRLPRPAALDRDPRVQDEEPAEAGQVVRRGWLRKRFLSRLAEDDAERRAARAEVALRRERDVNLQAVREQEDAVDRADGGQVPVMDGAELVGETGGPVGHDDAHVGVLGEAEVDVDVGPAVLLTLGGRPSGRRARDTVVLAGELEQPCADALAILRREHARNSGGRPRARGSSSRP